ncbi:MAG: PIN domain-containing protein [Nanoarchaeota archaeon]|nr:PIN domain-containing protein [Nanoarchaeota archaeon]
MKFLDTYAIIEIIQGNPKYKHVADEPFVTTIQNIMEVYYYFLRTADDEAAEKYFSWFRLVCTPISDGAIKAAMKLRLEQRKQRNLISYVDCIGYAVALERGIPFVSGEKHFRNLENVEFIV